MNQINAATLEKVKAALDALTGEDDGIVYKSSDGHYYVAYREDVAIDSQVLTIIAALETSPPPLDSEVAEANDFLQRMRCTFHPESYASKHLDTLIQAATKNPKRVIEMCEEIERLRKSLEATTDYLKATGGQGLIGAYADTWAYVVADAEKLLANAGGG